MRFLICLLALASCAQLAPGPGEPTVIRDQVAGSGAVLEAELPQPWGIYAGVATSALLAGAVLARKLKMAKAAAETPSGEAK